VSTTRTPADVLRHARQQDSQRKRARVIAVVNDMLATGTPVTFTAVRETAQVSKWLVYADGVREHIDQARTQQAGRKVRDRRRGLQPSIASLQTDLELARANNARLRTERDRLMAAVQRGLGHQLNQLAAKDLAARIDELTHANQQLLTELARLRADNEGFRRRLAETEDDLAAARASLRRMIRSENARPEPG
jgi:chromosome segregation ATPase